MKDTLPSRAMTVRANQVDKDYLLDVFRFRELFFFFALRDILVRYRQAFFGIAWAIIRPVLTMAVFVLIFGKIAHLGSQGINYPLFVLAAMIPYQLLAISTQESCNSLLSNAPLITKAYFPRVIIPASQLMGYLVDFCVNVVFLALLFLIFGETVSYSLAFLPLFFLLTITLCFGLGLWFSALTVQYRDFRIVVPFVMQFGMFVSPIGYGTFIIPEHLQYFYFLNPLVGIIDGVRWCLFGSTYPLLWLSISISCFLSLFLLVTGYRYFRKMERTFADKL